MGRATIDMISTAATAHKATIRPARIVYVLGSKVLRGRRHV